MIRPTAIAATTANTFPVMFSTLSQNNGAVTNSADTETSKFPDMIAMVMKAAAMITIAVEDVRRLRSVAKPSAVIEHDKQADGDQRMP